MSETRSFASAEHGKEEVKEKYMENTGWHAVYFITPFRKNAPFISIPFSLSEKHYMYSRTDQVKLVKDSL